MIPRTAETNAVEEALSSLALVAMVGGCRPPVTPADVCNFLESFYHVPAEAFTVCRYASEDFLVHFNATADLENVLHASVPLGTPFYLVWKRGHRQSMAASGPLWFKVLLGLRGIPAHLCNVDTAERILGSSCANIAEAPQMTTREDLHEFFVAGWCIRPRFIP